MKIRFFTALVLLLWQTAAQAQFDHSRWDALLRSHVVASTGGQQTAVDYAALDSERGKLHAYLEQLAAVDKMTFERWDESEQLAFLINTYNAWTVELILRHWPDIDSIREIGFLPGAAWRQRIVSLFGEQVSLDAVEHDMIRGWGRYNEPRIHFAVNCAAIGCPALRAEAYTGDKLAQQLDNNTALFLADHSRNYIDGETVYLSRIFDWYEEDFEQDWQGFDSVLEFIRHYADAIANNASQESRLNTNELRIRYLDYDWGLNKLDEQL